MKNLMIVGIGMIVAGIVVGAYNLPLGLLIVVVGIGDIAYVAMQRPKTAATDSVGDEFNPQYRVYLAPLRKLHAEIEQLVQEHPTSTTIRVIGAEALEESKGVLESAAKLVAAAESVKHALRGKTDAESDLVDLQERVATAATDEERATLERGIAARKLEIERYAALDRQLASIQAGLRQAEAALAEVKSRLVLVASKPEAVDAGDDELRDRLSKLHALSDSLGESDALLEEKQP